MKPTPCGKCSQNQTCKNKFTAIGTGECVLVKDYREKELMHYASLRERIQNDKG